ncbi:MAG: asparagine synthase-related protein, partial [Polyangiaceae bacterium]
MLPSRAGHAFVRQSPQDLATGLREQLELAVRRTVGEARRVAVLVSGGLDSSGILAVALALQPGACESRQIEAIAEVCASPGDDRPHLATLERALDLAAVRVPARAASRWFERSLCADAQPQVFAAGCGEMLLWATGLARGADVALGGH